MRKEENGLAFLIVSRRLRGGSTGGRSCWGYSRIAGATEAIPLAPVLMRGVCLPRNLPALPTLPMRAIFEDKNAQET